MKQIMLFLLIILCSTSGAVAETYKWTNDQGVVGFTDDPSMIPSQYRSKALKGENTTIRSTKVQKELRKKKGTKRQGEIRKPRILVPAGSSLPKSAPPSIQQQPNNGHPGGDQIDPTPPSMKQPIPAPLGDQPKPTPVGMKQPMPVPLGEQPTPTPLGMTQPIPEPLGDQPTPTPLGMEQPIPKQ